MSELFAPIEREHDSHTADRIRAHLDATMPGWRSSQHMGHVLRLLVAIVDEQRERIEALEAKLAAAATAGPPQVREYTGPRTYTSGTTPNGYWR